MKKLYLVDFDGTITKQDTLDYIAKEFFPEKYEEWGRKIMSKEYSVSQWIDSFVEEFNIEQSDYDKALEKIEIDPSFKKFIENRDVIIVSGGFDYNIRKILERFEINGIQYYANSFNFISSKKIEVKRPYFNDLCSEEAVCKKDILFKYREEYDEIVYIGDGITDICVAKYSDLIYAKKGAYLEKKLKKDNCDYIAFDSFNDIT